MLRSLRMAKSTAIQQTMYFHSSPLVTLQQEKLLRFELPSLKIRQSPSKIQNFLLWTFRPTRKPLKRYTNKKFMCKPKEIPSLQILQQTTIQVSFLHFLMIKGGQRRWMNNLSLFEELKKDLWLLMSLKEKDRLFYSSFHMG